MSDEFKASRKTRYNELSTLILSRNNETNVELKPYDYAYYGDGFYIWKNNSKSDWTFIGNSIPIEGNREYIKFVREAIDNGTFDSNSKGYRNNADIIKRTHGNTNRLNSDDNVDVQ